MNEDKQNQNRKNAMNFGGAVYVGVVVAATTLFVSFILTAFPPDAYVSRLVMVVAGALVGGSMLAFPLALHSWAISGSHRTWTTWLYYGEMLIIAVNTVVSFGVLLSKYTGYEMPEWAILYEPFSIGSIVYTLFAWGTIFRLDPQAQRDAKERAFDDQYEDKIAAKRLEFLDTHEGEDAIMEAAHDDIRHRISGKLRNGKKHFGSGNGNVIPATAPFVKRTYEQAVPIVQQPDLEKDDVTFWKQANEANAAKLRNGQEEQPKNGNGFREQG